MSEITPLQILAVLPFIQSAAFADELTADQALAKIRETLCAAGLT